MEMRELRGDDLFTIMAILGKLEIKDDLVAAYTQNKEATVLPGAKLPKKPTKAEAAAEKARQEAEAEARGVKIMATIAQRVMLNIGLVKEDINSLLADLTGTSVAEITQLGMVPYTKLVIQLFKRPEFKEVFTSAVSLLSEDPTEAATETASTN